MLSVVLSRLKYFLQTRFLMFAARLHNGRQFCRLLLPNVSFFLILTYLRRRLPVRLCKEALFHIETVRLRIPVLILPLRILSLFREIRRSNKRDIRRFRRRYRRLCRRYFPFLFLHTQFDMFRQKAPEFQKRRFRYFWIRTDRNSFDRAFLFRRNSM